jgi:hypothetical protein
MTFAHTRAERLEPMRIAHASQVCHAFKRAERLEPMRNLNDFRTYCHYLMMAERLMPMRIKIVTIIESLFSPGEFRFMIVICVASESPI